MNWVVVATQRLDQPAQEILFVPCRNSFVFLRPTCRIISLLFTLSYFHLLYSLYLKLCSSYQLVGCIRGSINYFPTVFAPSQWLVSMHPRPKRATDFRQKLVLTLEAIFSPFFRMLSMNFAIKTNHQYHENWVWHLRMCTQSFFSGFSLVATWQLQCYVSKSGSYSATFQNGIALAFSGRLPDRIQLFVGNLHDSHKWLCDLCTIVLGALSMGFHSRSDSCFPDGPTG